MNEEVVEKFIDKTENVLGIISSHPTLFPVINKKKQIHKCLVVKQISLYYVIRDKSIDLITFWNNYQHPGRLKF